MPQAIRVTPDNFCRAETDLYFTNFVKEGAFGKFVHNREPTPLDQQKVVRMNRDTLYSSAVFDLDAGPVKITMPDAGARFMSLQVWDEDEYCPLVAYGAGTYELTREGIGTRAESVDATGSGFNFGEGARPQAPAKPRPASSSGCVRISEFGTRACHTCTT